MTCSRPQRNVHRPGFEPGTPWSEIRRPNHCATPQPLRYKPILIPDKLYKQGLRLRKHKEHNYRDPLYSSDWVTYVVSTESDMVLNYTKLAVTLGLLRLNHNDPIAMGDVDRIMLVNQYLYLIYKHNNCPKYAFGILETIFQSKILLTE